MQLVANLHIVHDKFFFYDDLIKFFIFIFLQFNLI